jgi:hypothetical protein
VAGLRPAGNEVSPGIWVEQGAVVAASATLHPPILVGQEANVAENVTIQVPR